MEDHGWPKTTSHGKGNFPLNTHGGQLSCGQADLAGGMSHIVEAVRQLRQDVDGRQVKNAEWALVTGNGATMSEANSSHF